MFRIYVDDGCRRPMCVACSKFAENGHAASPANRRRAEARSEDMERRGVEIAALFKLAQPGEMVTRSQ
eukprot:3943798-Lingulodinium_polyedra.AAC.1